MINPASFATAIVVAITFVVTGPADGFAQMKTNEHPNERVIVLPRPQMRTQPGVIAGPIASPTRNAMPVAPPAPNRMGDRDRDHDRDRAAFAAGVAAGVVLGGSVATPGIYYVPSPVDDPVGYCMQTYSSYDPRSGTYIGDDGNPYPCP
jgi:hypothetical protein